jgi:uncharacterized DUF497 family protein
MSGPFEWDEGKAERNLRLHGVAFSEAVKVFDDTRAIEEYDAEHSSKDDARYTRIGLSGTRLSIRGLYRARGENKDNSRPEGRSNNGETLCQATNELRNSGRSVN